MRHTVRARARALFRYTRRLCALPERRRLQEIYVGLDSSLLEVVDVGLITCVGVGLVRQVHTHFVRSAQVVHELQVPEEVEVNGESKVEESRSLHEHADDMDDKHKTLDLNHGECARDVTLC